ncbi:DUF6711 family protein [Bacillus sp. OK048]|uniref:DUF6711 family protein n=1 Tax=Bacillus sp. OK048 TaxID=1882761 RepID=UPI0008906E01|nr:DUF6711 family protein [Bacillus sp. OK048]SDM17300.1 hypothetical protein SAMN05443253_102162 [Bacillus sp. OK048]
MAILKIDSTDLPSPTDLLLGVMDISKSERNANGTLIKEHIATKQKLEITWAFLTKQQLNQIFILVSSNFFEVTYTDPISGNERTGTFYAGDRKVGIMDIRNGVIRYKDVQFNVIER